jgi:hypothetical protein
MRRSPGSRFRAPGDAALLRRQLVLPRFVLQAGQWIARVLIALRARDFSSGNVASHLRKD